MAQSTIFSRKLKAFSASLFLSLAFTGLLSLAAYLWWYPDYLFWLDGGFQGLKLVFMVDLVLGPVLVFVAYNPSKTPRHQAMDLSMLFLIQISAMIWGGWQVYSERPVAVVLGNGQITTVSASTLARQNHKVEQLKPFGETPVFVCSKIEKEVLRKMLADPQLDRSIAPSHRFEFFADLASCWEDEKKRAEEVLVSLSETNKTKIEQIKQAAALSADQYILFEARHSAGLLFFNQQRQIIYWKALYEK